MALWLTAVLALACLGGLAAPGPVLRSAAPSDVPLRELIEELINITQDQRVSNTHTHPSLERVVSRLSLVLCVPPRKLPVPRLKSEGEEKLAWGGGSSVASKLFPKRKIFTSEQAYAKKTW